MGTGKKSANSLFGENSLLCSRGLQSIADILGDFLLRQGINIKINCYPLTDRPVPLFQDEVVELMLTDEKDIYQLALHPFKIGEETNFFKKFGGETLRLVNDKKDLLAVGVRVVKKLTEMNEKGALV